jgi:2-aminoadipate transaminase
VKTLVIPSPTGAAGADYGNRLPYDFGVGYINPATLPVSDLEALAGEVVRELDDELARYPARRGWEPLRASVCDLRSRRGEPRPELDSIVLTNGSLGAIQLAIEAFASSGDVVVVEEWTYNVAMTVFRHRELEIVPVPIDADGPIPEALAQACGDAQAAGRRVVLYTIPTFHNPTGITVSAARRAAIVAVARERDIGILEDDCYGDLRLDGEQVPSIWSMAPERTVLIGSLSKILAPALRLGYVIVPEGTVGEFLARKLDGGTDLLSAAVAATFLDRHADEHLARLLSGLRRKRDQFLDALRTHCPDFVVERVPAGGLYVWARLPQGVSSARLLAAAEAHGVTFFPTPMCRADRRDGEFARFSFPWASAREVEEGLARLASLVPSPSDDAASLERSIDGGIE